MERWNNKKIGYKGDKSEMPIWLMSVDIIRAMRISTDMSQVGQTLLPFVTHFYHLLCV